MNDGGCQTPRSSKPLRGVVKASRVGSIPIHPRHHPLNWPPKRLVLPGAFARPVRDHIGPMIGEATHRARRKTWQVR